ncbi:MAG: lysophospholipid acyltransferase family protein [Deltaproteobacteria bacterium]|jgi:KDO2-lipid IV(A) lauroyltransferase|nr:lysophospholipid acyltransferase family protein [Deltaproteobacteria bacterium]MDL1988434.1 lysophospholipid acyltransferase family protein [Deltaproteobacteria bacterium]
MSKPKDFSSSIKTFIVGIPKKYIVKTGNILGSIAYLFDARHRRIVRRNLKFANPEWPLDKIKKISIKTFQNMGISVLEICQMTCFSKEDILKKVRIKGKENLLNTIKSPKGLIMISAHIGNWEMSHLFVSIYIQKSLLVVVQNQPVFIERIIHKLRTSTGNTIISKKGAMIKLVRILRKGKMIGLLIDQGTSRGEGVDVTFFGRNTNATYAASLLAARYNCPVLPVYCIREPNANLTVIVEPPLKLHKTDDVRADLQTNTQIMTDSVEKIVSLYPEQWLWFHKRWKRHYPDLYPEDLARRQRQREKRRARCPKKR